MSIFQGLIPQKNSTQNINICDTIGNKLDDEDGDSLYSKNYMLNRHIHSESKVYPTLANGVVVNGGAGAWALSAAFTQIVPINTITIPFDIHYINVADASAADVYELVLYASTVEIGRVRFVKGTGATTAPLIPMMTPIIPANTQIQAKVASSSGGDNVTISIFYHTY